MSRVKNEKGAAARKDRGIGATEGYVGGIWQEILGADCRAERTGFLINNRSRRGQGTTSQSSSFQGACSGTEEQDAPTIRSYRIIKVQGIAGRQSARRDFGNLFMFCRQIARHLRSPDRKDGENGSE